MNRHFLEFWGKALLEAAKSQKQLEDLAKWLPRGFLGFQDFTQLFKSSYGLNEVAEDSPDYLAMFKKAEADFRESFKDYLNLLGGVPREEYVALARKHEALQAKVAEQAEIIEHLRTLVDEKGLSLEATSMEFQRLIQKQGEQFQQFLQGLGQSVDESLDPDGKSA
ncbi:MAG: hypothetical protein P8168_03035 [Deltaproteobacteria bacterium]|jgi:hypothetical protein